MKLNDACYFAFVETKDIASVERTLGVTHAGSGAGACAGGSMQHVALNVDTLDDLLAMRDRIRSRGITVFGPLNHVPCRGGQDRRRSSHWSSTHGSLLYI